MTVTDVRFEFSPGRGDPRYTETWWAFDVFVDYRLPDGTRGFTGIEVKYHEDLKQPPKSRSGPNARCVELTGEALPGADLDALWRAPVWQLWLDDLLARSMINSGKYRHGDFLVLAPGDNMPCITAVAAYNTLIAPARVRLVTLEAYLAVVAAVTDADWVAALGERYLGVHPG